MKRSEIIESNKYFDCIFNHGPIGIAIVDLKGKFIRANNTACKIWGYPEKELQKKTFMDITHPDEIKRDWEGVKKLAAGKIKNYKIKKRYITKNKNIIWGSVNVFLSKNKKNKPEYFVVTIEDITKQEKTEQTLKKNELKFKAIFEETFQFTGLMTTEGVLLEANKAALKFIKIKKSDFTDKPFWDCKWWSCDRSLQLKIKEAIKKAAKGEFIRYVTKICTPKGTEAYIDFSIKPIKDKKGKVILLIPEGRDVTEQKKIEENLKNNTKTLESIIDFLPDATLIIDKNKKIVGWNKAIEKMTGISRKKMLNKEHSYASVPFYGIRRKYLIDLLSNPEESTYKKYNKVKKDKNILYAEAFTPKLKNNHGAYIWVAAANIFDGQGNIIGAIESIRDISEKRKYEEEIKKAKEKFESLLDSMDDIVFEFDPQGKIIFYHSLNEKELYISPEYFLNKKYNTVLPPHVIKLLNKAITKNKKHVIDSFQYPLDINKKQEWFSAKITPIFTDHNYAGSVAVIRKVTKEKEIDIMKTEFVSLASHQLRTPITSINWNSEILLNDKKNPLNEKQKSIVKEIYRSNKRMIELVNALLNVARLEMGTVDIAPKNIDPRKICHPIINELIPLINKKNITINQWCDQKIKLVKLDPKVFGLVFQNILSNAVKYSDDGTKIFIKLEKKENSMIFSVTNQGIGIPEKDKENIFTKLFRSDEARLKDPDGTGLGLYIIKLILNQSGGDIWFQSEKNKETTFYVRFPITGMKRHEGTKFLA